MASCSPLVFFEVVQCKKLALTQLQLMISIYKKVLNIEDKAERIKKIYENNEKRSGDYWVFLWGRRGPSAAAGSLSGHIIPNGKPKGLHEVLPENVT